jgi:membrane-bound lytic murein transglycosylase D
VQSEHKSSSLFLNLIFFSLLLGGCVLTPLEPVDQSLDSGLPQEPVETATKIVAAGSLTGAEGSLIGAEGSLTGAEGSLTGAEGSLTGAEGSLTDADGTLANLEVPDLWQRIRSGHNLTPEVLPTSVLKQRDWYLRNPSYLATVFGRAEPFIFYVTDELDKAGLPLELALLPIVESTYDPLAYSHSHAVGLWQFIPSTAKSFGLRRDRWYDGRRDVIYSTQAAVKYLKYLHRRFDNDWLLALAAYNSGEGNVRKSIKRNRKLGKKTDFWSIKLPRETRNYVPQLLALATLIENPEKFDIKLPFIADQAYFEVVEIESQIDLNKVIEITGVEGTAFTKLNPAYRRSITPPQGKHNLLLPVGSAEPLRQLLVTTDPKTWVPHTEYQVVSGDSLSQIAQRFRVPTQWLKSRNNLRSDRLRIGQVLLIPHSGDSTTASDSKVAQTSLYSVKRGDTLSGIAVLYKTSIAALKRANKLTTDRLQIGQKLTIKHSSAGPTPENLRRLSYRVRRGDSLYLIAEKFDLTIRDITRWNKISRNEFLQPGQRLTLFINALRI